MNKLLKFLVAVILILFIIFIAIPFIVGLFVTSNVI